LALGHAVTFRLYQHLAQFSCPNQMGVPQSWPQLRVHRAQRALSTSGYFSSASYLVRLLPISSDIWSPESAPYDSLLRALTTNP
jgi:hypothetical protein